MELLKQLMDCEYLKEVAKQEGWYVEDQNDKNVAGPFKTEQEAKTKCQQLGGDAKGFTVGYVSDYAARRMSESLGSRVEYDSYELWKADLPKNSTFHKDQNLERAQALSKQYEGVAGTWNSSTKKGWIYAHYLDKKNLKENWAKNLAAQNRARMKKEKEEAKAALEKKIAERVAKQQTAQKEYFQKLARIVQDCVANSVPDSDGLDQAFRQARKLGARELDAMDDLDKACKLHLGAKSYYDYFSQVMKDIGSGDLG